MFHLAKVPKISKPERTVPDMQPTYVVTSITQNEISFIDSVSGDVLLVMSPVAAVNMAKEILTLSGAFVGEFTNNQPIETELQTIKNINEILKDLLLLASKSKLD